MDSGIFSGTSSGSGAAGGVRRVLVTGFRQWTDAATTIRAAFAEQWGDGRALLISGVCPCPAGADRIAERFWTRLSLLSQLSSALVTVSGSSAMVRNSGPGR